MAEAPTDTSFCDPHMLAGVFQSLRPFAMLTNSARREQLRLSGMHSPFREDHAGCDAFDIRADLTVADACEAVDRLLKQLQGTLELLSCSDQSGCGLNEVSGACASLAKQAAGAHAVIKAAVFPGDLR